MSNKNFDETEDVNTVEYSSTMEMLLNLLVRWRRVFLWCVLISVVVSTIVAFLITPKFKSTSTVFPAERTDLFGAIEGVSSQLKSLSSARGLASLAGNVELDKYMIILKSGRVLSAVINKFDLVHVYKIKSYPMEKTALELLDNVDFSTEEESSLSITVYDEDPQRAADMANFFVAELSRTNTELQIQNAKANRSFIEERYNQNLIDLAAAEDSLRFFQKRYGVISMTDQVEASVKAAAELSGQLVIKEVQLEVEKRTSSSDHPAVVGTKFEIEELRKKIQQMNEPIKGQLFPMKVFIPFAEVPDLGTEYLRRYRNVEIQYKILQFITPIFEQAKVDEQRNTPSVVVLDRAMPAERKSRPKRILVILGGILLGLLSTFGYAVLSDRWMLEKKMNTSFYQSSIQLADAIKSDMHTVRLWMRKKKE
jgi:tyrosine-protein kinase Etk/Wzc